MNEEESSLDELFCILDHPHAGFHKYLPEGEVNDA